MQPTKIPFHVMAKPIGPKCNLNCHYCFYLAKEQLFTDSDSFRMNEQLLEEYVRQYMQSQPGPEISFSWQGGEPTLMGVDFFRKVVQLQDKYLPAGWSCKNAIQTNGTLIDEDWAEFLHQHDFLVGLSVDGPASLHDTYRKDRQGQGTFHRVKETARLFKEKEVQFNILCVVNRDNSKQPQAVYSSLKELGADYIQFIPLVAKLPDGTISEESTTGELYGKFLISIFNTWLREDVGKVFLQIIEEAVARWANYPPTLCVFAPECGSQVIIEHNGDVYSCDHFVSPEFRLGSIFEKPLEELVNAPSQKQFGQEKANLSEKCTKCPVLFICRGGCPKNRIERQNILCEGYFRFFSYIDPFVKQLVQGLQEGKIASQIQPTLVSLLDKTWDVSRNDPCPCGSNRKYKKCCLNSSS